MASQKLCQYCIYWAMKAVLCLAKYKKSYSAGNCEENAHTRVKSAMDLFQAKEIKKVQADKENLKPETIKKNSYSCTRHRKKANQMKLRVS